MEGSAGLRVRVHSAPRESRRGLVPTTVMMNKALKLGLDGLQLTEPFHFSHPLFSREKGTH